MQGARATLDAEFAGFLSLAHALADAAGSAILPEFRAGGPIDNKSQAGRFDPVTAADRNAEQAIRAALAARYPSHGIEGEEFGVERAEAEYRWVVDPVDGTRAFIMGLPLWGTLIGLTRNGRPILGVVDQPFIGERFWSEEREAHYRGPAGARRLHTRACGRLEDAALSTTDPDLFAPGFERDRFEALSARARLRRYGGDCYAYCLLAAGHIDLVVEAGLKPHDIVALIPIVERAGGRATCWDGSDAAKGGRILAAGDPRLHAAALEALAG